MAPSSVKLRPVDLAVPPHLVADAPIEASGGRRDDVRMLVAHRGTGELVHTRARHLAQVLDAGDVLVVNTSPTLPAAVPSADGRLLLHLSTDLGDGRWVVELRQPSRAGSAPHRSARRLTIELAGGAVADLEVPHRPADERGARLWVARLSTPVPFSAWLAAEGRPIRYGRADQRWPIGAYQTFFAGHPPGDRGLGSAEMPSAARFVTPEVVSELIGAGVDLVPITLHTGVSSLEAGEPPYAERYVVSPSSARRINDAKAAGARIIAVGTTATRAVETDARDGRARPGEGWTELVITPERGLEVVDGIISGWHEPEASHLLLMEAVAGRSLLEASYRAAVAGGYRWHEFGDVHLVLP